MDPITGAILGSAISAGANYGLGKLFGGKKGSAQAPLANFRPAGFSGGGLSAAAGNDGNINVTASPERLGLVRDVADTYGQLSDELGGIRARVAPGVSDLRAVRMAEIENARTSAIGNLRDNLARRRILGSSFGQDALVRAENEFGLAKDKVAAETFMQELGLTTDLMREQFSAKRSQFQTGLDELNLEAQIATKLSGDANTQLGANARVLAQLNASEQAGAGKFFGQVFQPIMTAMKGTGSSSSGRDPAGWVNGIPSNTGLNGYAGSY